MNTIIFPIAFKDKLKNILRYLYGISFFDFYCYIIIINYLTLMIVLFN